jgi:hypothetical protein
MGRRNRKHEPVTNCDRFPKARRDPQFPLRVFAQRKCGDAHLHRSFTAQNGRKHCHTMLGEGKRLIFNAFSMRSQIVTSSRVLPREIAET